MNRIFILLVILALIPLACADPTADSLSVSSASGDPGETNIPVLVNITNAVDGPIMVLTFDVIYDGNVIELTKVRCGSALPTDGGYPMWSAKLGTNKKSITLCTNEYDDYALANGTAGNIVKLYFNVTGITGQTTSIELADIDLSSTGLVHGTIPAVNGTFTITGGIPGDLNRDGVVTSTDAAIALQIAVSGEYDALADVDDDDSVTSLDALLIMQVAADRVII